MRRNRPSPDLLQQGVAFPDEFAVFVPRSLDGFGQAGDEGFEGLGPGFDGADLGCPVDSGRVLAHFLNKDAPALLAGLASLEGLELGGSGLVRGCGFWGGGFAPAYRRCLRLRSAPAICSPLCD